MLQESDLLQSAAYEVCGRVVQYCICWHKWIGGSLKFTVATRIVCDTRVLDDGASCICRHRHSDVMYTNGDTAQRRREASISNKRHDIYIIAHLSSRNDLLRPATSSGNTIGA